MLLSEPSSRRVHIIHTMAALEFFQCEQDDLERFFRHEGVGIKIDHSITLKYKPSDMTMTLHGSGEIVC